MIDETKIIDLIKGGGNSRALPPFRLEDWRYNRERRGYAIDDAYAFGRMVYRSNSRTINALADYVCYLEDVIECLAGAIDAIRETDQER